MDWRRWRFPRRHRERHEVLEQLEDLARGLLLLRLVAGVLAAVAGAALLRDGEPLGAAVLAGGVGLLAFGQARRLLLAAGWPKSAAHAAWADGWTWGRDPDGGRLATLAEAALRGLTSGQGWFAERRAAVLRLTAGGVLAEGMERLRTGDLEDGRRLLALVAEFDRSVRPPIAHRQATELAMVEAAGRGAWGEVLAVAAEPRAARSALTRLLVLVARRVRGEPVSPGVLRAAAWLVSPLGRALPLADRAAGAAPLPPGPTRADLVAEARAWEGRLADPLVVEGWRSRAAALRAKVDPVAVVRAEVVAGLARRLERLGGPPAGEEPGELWAEVVRTVAERRLERVRALAEALQRRTKAKRALPLVDEVLDLLRLDAAAEAVAEIDPGRRVAAHLQSWGALVNHTVWLHNERGQATVANALYRVQHRRAVAAGHPQAIELMAKNLQCGP